MGAAELAVDKSCEGESMHETIVNWASLVGCLAAYHL